MAARADRLGTAADADFRADALPGPTSIHVDAAGRQHVGGEGPRAHGLDRRRLPMARFGSSRRAALRERSNSSRVMVPEGGAFELDHERPSRSGPLLGPLTPRQVQNRCSAEVGRLVPTSNSCTGVHPREWTRSGCGFDHLPGVLLFEPDGAPISERGMEPLAVVDLVDEARQ